MIGLEIVMATYKIDLKNVYMYLTTLHIIYHEYYP
jgi:hypothetical protein